MEVVKRGAEGLRGVLLVGRVILGLAYAGVGQPVVEGVPM